MPLSEEDRESFFTVLAKSPLRHMADLDAEIWEALRDAGLVEPAPLEPGDYEVWFRTAGPAWLCRWDGKEWFDIRDGVGPQEVVQTPIRIGRRLTDAKD